MNFTDYLLKEFIRTKKYSLNRFYGALFQETLAEDQMDVEIKNL